MVTRAEPRDFLDVAAALDRYSRDELLALAQQADPALAHDEVADAVRRLDRMPDEVFRLYGRTPEQVAHVRAAVAAWPR